MMNNDYSRNNKFENEFNNVKAINNENFDNYNVDAPPVTLTTLKPIFKIYDSKNYLALCQSYDSMSETEQKLFILYSFFHFELIFNQEDIESIFTNQVFNKMTQLANEFKEYGSYDGCALRCAFNINGPTLIGTGKNENIPLEVENVVNSLDYISVEELAELANKGSYYHSNEERMFKQMNDQYQNEFNAFREIIGTYKISKTA